MKPSRRHILKLPLLAAVPYIANAQRSVDPHAIASMLMLGFLGSSPQSASATALTQDLAERYGVPFFRSKVGEANVCDRMIAEKAVFGGEGNGGPIDPRVGYVRDSFVGMALVLSLMAERDQSLGALVDALPRYAIHKTKVTLGPEAVPTAIDKLKAHFDAAEPNELDGLRLDWSDKWFLFRASNTEPIVRFVAEAPTDEEASRLCNEAIAVIQA